MWVEIVASKPLPVEPRRWRRRARRVWRARCWPRQEVGEYPTDVKAATCPDCQIIRS